MEARYKIKITTGRKSREMDERQAEAIRDLPHWARQPGPGAPGT